MSIILSMSQGYGGVWAAGPEGLYKVTSSEQQAAGEQQVAQPQQNLYCCAAIHDRILVGGLPYGVAFSLMDGEDWQAGWMDNVNAPVVTLAADPQVEYTCVLLAGTDGGGVLRSVNRGRHWYTRNFGLRSYSVLALAWAPPAPRDAWPRWQMVFACTEEGVYHSPNGGRGWKRSEGPEAVYQTIAVAPDYQQSRLVLAGTEADGLYRSTDGGYTFQPVSEAPAQVNALAATTQGWLLSDADQLYHSSDGLHWSPLSDTPALVLIANGEMAWAGTENGVQKIALNPAMAAA